MGRRPGRALRNSRELHAGIGRDELRYASRSHQCRGAVIALAQIRNHVAPDVAGARIVDHRLQSVADFDLVLPCLSARSG